MIATHNIKVNGRWYKAGEEVPETGKSRKPVQEPAEAKISEPEVTEVEAVKAEATPRVSSRRKANR